MRVRLCFLIGCIFTVLFISCEKPEVLPFEVVGKRIVLNANVNGKTGRYMWDTGAFLTQADCTFDNLKFLASTSYALLGSSENLSYYQLDEVIFNNGITVKAKSKVSKISSANKIMLQSENLDGVLGNNTFNGYWVKLSFSKNKIFLYKNKPFNFYKKVASRYENDNLIITGKINQREMSFIIDTGAREDFLFTDSLNDLLQTEKYAVSSNTNKNIFLVKIDTLKVLQTKMKSIWAITDGVHYQTTLSDTKGNIGLNLLQSYDLIIDYTNLDTMGSTYIYFKRNNLKMDPSTTFFNVSPSNGIVRAARTNDGIFIIYIETNCQLSKKGIVPGSIITKINGKSINSYSSDELLNYIYHPKSDTTYTIKTNATEQTVEFIKN